MNATPLSLDKAGLAQLIPHSGDMMLLDALEAWGPDFVVCTASSHRLPANPLREPGGLPSAAAMEYAAQAMAAHSALCGQASGGQDDPPRRGFIVVVSGVRWSAPWLDAGGPVLRIEATRTASLGDGAQYAFEVGDGAGLTVTGVLTLSLETAPTEM